jgi:hypothetical protein
MKNSTKVTFLIESGISLNTISKMNQNQINLMVERFKKFKKEENKEAVVQKTTTTYEIPTADLEKGTTIPEVPGKKMTIQKTPTGIKATPTESEMTEDVDVDKDDTTAGQISQDPHQVQAPDGMGDDGDTQIDKEEDLATESVIKEKFESKAQQGLFWARCNKCSSKNCKWCKMAKEFSDSTSKKQYKEMPEKKHPEKTVKVKKEKTNEETQQYWENKILRMLEEEKKKKSQKKDSESMILRKPKKVTMFSDEAPMKLPIAKMFSIGKK